MNSIILITDSIPSADGGGISQTLYNLLDSYPERIYVICNADEQVTVNSLKANFIRFKYLRFSPLKNRLGVVFNPVIEKFNLQRLQSGNFSLAGLPDTSKSFILVSTTETSRLLLAYQLHKKWQYKLVPYFMDDWMCNKQLKWQGGNLQELVQKILASSYSWIMISAQLSKAVQQRYKVSPLNELVVHNPVVVQETKNGLAAEHQGRIIYAGSIWPMHLDALVIVAEAVRLLHQTGNQCFSLDIYTPEHFWLQHKHLFEKKGVRWAGFISYGDIHKVLSKGWLLLCTASFKKEHASFTASSVQTKLTDYMSVGRPVLYVGPAHGASGEFVKNWDAGFITDTVNASVLAEQLLTFKEDLSGWIEKANNGQEAVVKNFSKKTVQKKFYDFINQLN